jgi:hypothetical protein
MILHHNEIRDLVMDKVTKPVLDVSVMMEPIIREPSAGILKPEVIQNKGRVRVVDGVVRHEDFLTHRIIRLGTTGNIPARAVAVPV